MIVAAVGPRQEAQERGQNNMDDIGGAWIRRSDAEEERRRLSEALKGWWKLVRPFKAWGLYRKLRATNETRRKATNERFVRKRLGDPTLANLNEDQRRAVIVQEDRTLIVAGAGTGKTHTMVAKARDTVRSGIAKPKEIAFVTFTRKAAQEIRDRSGDLTGMEIGTIHHLARVVIMQVEGRKPRLSPLVEDETRRLTQLETWLLEAVQEDPSLLADLETRRQAVMRCHAPQGEMPPGVRVPPDKVLVRSVGEARIATTLHLAEVPYRYEAEFPVPEEHQGNEGKRYFPDFYLPDAPEEWGRAHGPASAHAGVWLEHFANDANGKLPEGWDEDGPGTTAEYRRTRVWKEALHRTLGTRFASTEYGDIQWCTRDGKSFPDLVLARIASQGKTGFNPPSQWDVRSVIRQMKEEDAKTEHMQVTYEIDAWVRTRRQQVRSESTLMDAITGGDTADESSALWRLARPVLERYVRHLVETDTTDHEGTILKAWRYLRDGAAAPPWKAVLVDEYQDVNPAQAASVHALLAPRDPERPSSGAQFTAVGDDWQAIFGFQGGDVDLIREFNDPAGAHGGATERIALRQTYRFGQPLADSTRRFVTRGRGAIDREIVGAPGMTPDPRWPSSIVVAPSKLTPEGEKRVGGRHRSFTGGVLAALERIGEQSKNAEVLVIARRNSELEMPPEDWAKATGINRKVINARARRNGLKVTYSTVHKAKGTEADYIILLDGGPPRAGQAAEARALERALRVFRGDDTAEEEERRIWYVALTRARRKVYVIVSADIDSHSPFSDELYHNEGGAYDVGEDELAEFLEPLRPHVPCPVCTPRGRTTAVLAVRDGRHGRFAGCTSLAAGPDHHCGHRERVCEGCEQGLMIRLGNGRARCQNAECRHEAPLCRCTVPRPMVERRHGKTGQRFWGCQRYGMDVSCTATKRWDELGEAPSVRKRHRRGHENPQSRQRQGGADRGSRRNRQYLMNRADVALAGPGAGHHEGERRHKLSGEAAIDAKEVPRAGVKRGASSSTMHEACTQSGSRGRSASVGLQRVEHRANLRDK